MASMVERVVSGEDAESGAGGIVAVGRCEIAVSLRANFRFG